MLTQASVALSKMQIKERNAEPAPGKIAPSADLLAIRTFAPTAEPSLEVAVVNVDLFKTPIGGQCAGRSREADPASAGLSKIATREPIAER